GRKCWCPSSYILMFASVQVRAGWRSRYGSTPSRRRGGCPGSSGSRSRGGCRASHLPPPSHGSSPGKYPPREPVSLGGCRMANNPAAEVVDTDERGFGHPRPYVLDRAILSATAGVTPSHRVLAAARPLLSMRHGIGFNDTMRGQDLIQAGQAAQAAVSHHREIS